jgi:hypothetical protein
MITIIRSGRVLLFTGGLVFLPSYEHGERRISCENTLFWLLPGPPAHSQSPLIEFGSLYRPGYAIFDFVKLCLAGLTSRICWQRRARLSNYHFIDLL